MLWCSIFFPTVNVANNNVSSTNVSTYTGRDRAVRVTEPLTELLFAVFLTSFTAKNYEGIHHKIKQKQRCRR